jgi:hypothetical protein
MENTNESVLETIRMLVEGWCDRRSLVALRHILKGYPLSSSLTDGWSALLDSLQSVRAFAREELTEDEKATIGQIIGEISKVVHR